jgi:hypothetical protein
VEDEAALVDYDVKLEHEVVQPLDRWLAFMAMPDSTACCCLERD